MQPSSYTADQNHESGKKFNSRDHFAKNKNVRHDKEVFHYISRIIFYLTYFSANSFRQFLKKHLHQLHFPVMAVGYLDVLSC